MVSIDFLNIPNEDRASIACAIEAFERVYFGSVEAEVSVSYQSTEAIRSLNAQYRNKDVSTDVLSFPQYESLPEQGYFMLGDIVLCEPIIRAQSAQYEQSFHQELMYLVIHSMAHLCGYDHNSEEQRLEMRALEKKVLEEVSCVF